MAWNDPLEVPLRDSLDIPLHRSTSKLTQGSRERLREMFLRLVRSHQTTEFLMQPARRAQRSNNGHLPRVCRLRILLGAREIEEQICLDQGLGRGVEERDVFVLEAREIAVLDLETPGSGYGISYREWYDDLHRIRSRISYQVRPVPRLLALSDFCTNSE